MYHSVLCWLTLGLISSSWCGVGLTFIFVCVDHHLTRPTLKSLCYHTPVFICSCKILWTNHTNSLATHFLLCFFPSGLLFRGQQSVSARASHGRPEGALWWADFPQKPTGSEASSQGIWAEDRKAPEVCCWDSRDVEAHGGGQVENQVSILCESGHCETNPLVKLCALSTISSLWGFIFPSSFNKGFWLLPRGTMSTSEKKGKTAHGEVLAAETDPQPRIEKVSLVHKLYDQGTQWERLCVH